MKERIEITDTPKKRIDPQEVAKALGAEGPLDLVGHCPICNYPILDSGTKFLYGHTLYCSQHCVNRAVEAEIAEDEGREFGK